MAETAAEKAERLAELGTVFKTSMKEALAELDSEQAEAEAKAKAETEDKSAEGGEDDANPPRRTVSEWLLGR
jgi:hypothetical protein